MENTQTSLNGIKRNTKDLANNAVEAVADKANLSTSELKAYYDTAKEKASDAVEYSEGFVKKYPFYTVMGAAAIGLLAGVIIRGGRRN